MDKKIILVFLFAFFAISVYSQHKSIPKNIDQAIQFMVDDCPDSLKQAIKTNKNDTLIYLVSPWGMEHSSFRELSDWTPSEKRSKNRLEKYYSKRGINIKKHIHTIILIAFKNYLNTGKTDHENVIKPFQKIESRWNAEDKVRFTTDSLRGAYIPKNLEECFKLIDGFWSDSTKNEVKQMEEKNFLGRAHLGFGTWMRNNWQLWAGSRLSKYFNDKGVYHPESISCIILISYHRYLNGLPINLDEQIKQDQNLQKATRVPTKDMFPKGAGNLEFNTGIYYDSKKNGQGLIQVGTSSNSPDTWIYDYYLGWAKVSGAQISELTRAKMDERELVLNKIFQTQ